MIHWFIIAKILISVFPHQWEDGKKDIDRIIDIVFYGYFSIGNEVEVNKCCGKENEFPCASCVHRFTVEYWEENADRREEYLLTEFSDAGQEMYQTVNFENFHKSSEEKIITIGAISLNNSLIPYDYIPYMDPSIVGDYPLYGTISMKNLIVIYAHMKIFSLFKYEKYFNLIFVLDGIKWRIKDIKGGRCCFPLDTFLCDNPCNFEVEINISNKKVIFYKLQDRTDSSYYNLGRYIAIPNEEYKNKNLTLQINIKMNETTEIDSYKFENINVMASTEKLFIGVLGNLRNTEIYFGIKYYCIRSNGENCVNDCEEELHLRSEYCREDGSRACANGASDLDKCKNKSIKCTESLCNYHGICSYDQTQICICYPGYTGTVCQTWYCEHECHGNGECIGPNQCRCRYPYWGWECNKYQCDRKSKKICGDLGICSYNDQNFLCECKHPLIEGSYCDKIICTNSCVYGNCKYNELENKTHCLCLNGYYGDSCEYNIISAGIEPKRFIMPCIIAALSVFNLSIIIIIIISSSYFKLKFLLVVTESSNEAPPENIEN